MDEQTRTAAFNIYVNKLATLTHEHVLATVELDQLRSQNQELMNKVEELTPKDVEEPTPKKSKEK